MRQGSGFPGMDRRPNEGDIEAKSCRRIWREPLGHLQKKGPGRGTSKDKGPEAGMGLVCWEWQEPGQPAGSGERGVEDDVRERERGGGIKKSPPERWPPSPPGQPLAWIQNVPPAWEGSGALSVTIA